MSLLKTSIVYSQDQCAACTSAKYLLHLKGYEVEERKIGVGNKWTKKDLLDVVPGAKSVPQIFINGEYIGGFNELSAYLNPPK